MAKSKTTDTGSRPTQQPEQPAASAQTEQPLTVQLAELSAAISAIETEIERTQNTIRATPGRLARAKTDYDTCFLAADEAGQTAAQARIRAANEERAGALAAMDGYAAPIAALSSRMGDLRLKAVDAVTTTAAALESARIAASQAGRFLDAVGATGRRLADARRTIEVTK